MPEFVGSGVLPDSAGEVDVDSARISRTPCARGGAYPGGGIHEVENEAGGEDDSGIPIRYFKDDEWKLYPFGTYLQPLGIFPHTYQQQLSSLYRKERAGNLDFGIGYRWRPRESNLLLAIRGKRTAQGQ